MAEEDVPELCSGCVNSMHGKKCWYYWELKKECSMYRQHGESDIK